MEVRCLIRNSYHYGANQTPKQWLAPRSPPGLHPSVVVKGRDVPKVIEFPRRPPCAIDPPLPLCQANRLENCS